MILETERTTLRHLQTGDATGVLAVLSDPVAMAFAPMPLTTERTVAEQFIGWHRQNYESHGFSAWAVISKASREYVGHVGLIPHDIGVELFYALVPRFWGRGLAVEVAGACVQYAFGTVGLDRLIAVIHPQNARAIRVAEKLGATQNGIVQMWERENALYEIKRSDVQRA